MWHLCVALQQCTTVLPTDKRVMARMKELAAAGVRRVPEMQRHIKSFVCDLFAGSAVPPTTDARFWPSGQTVLNCIYRTTKLTRFVNSMHYFSLGYCVVIHVHCRTIPMEYKGKGTTASSMDLGSIFIHSCMLYALYCGIQGTAQHLLWHNVQSLTGSIAHDLFSEQHQLFLPVDHPPHQSIFVAITY